MDSILAGTVSECVVAVGISRRGEYGLFCLLIPVIAFWIGKRDALKEYERNLRDDVII